MEKKGLKSDEQTFKALIVGCANSGRSDEIPSLLIAMQKQCIVPDDATTFAATVGLSRDGRCDEILSLLNTVESSAKRAIDLDTYKAALVALANAGLCFVGCHYFVSPSSEIRRRSIRHTAICEYVSLSLFLLAWLRGFMATMLTSFED